MGWMQAIPAMVQAGAAVRDARTPDQPDATGLGGQATFKQLVSSSKEAMDKEPKSEFQAKLNELNENPSGEKPLRAGISAALAGDDQPKEFGLDLNSFDFSQPKEQQQPAEAEGSKFGDMMNKVNMGAQLAGSAAQSARANLPHPPATPNYGARASYRSQPTSQGFVTRERSPSLQEVLRAELLSGRRR